jgi:flap endonuclease-1
LHPHFRRLCYYAVLARGCGEPHTRYHTIDAILPHLKGMKGVEVPTDFPYAEARKLFVAPEVTAPAELEKDIKWVLPDEEALVKFMCEENGFAEKSIRGGIAKLTDGR